MEHEKQRMKVQKPRMDDAHVNMEDSINGRHGSMSTSFHGIEQMTTIHEGPAGGGCSWASAKSFCSIVQMTTCVRLGRRQFPGMASWPIIRSQIKGERKPLVIYLVHRG